ncbi:blue copper protein-like protein [Carex littledalei]|uniref:Blue copper protein-like protein n=1 Tax=Carex littledalei TaxID=544730 RepID=A0A833RQJ8_9POAL|nr:blue copper protein-like protein [Carex littledalei]
MALIRSLALGMLVLLNTAMSASATDYTVGDTSGWTTGLDYSKWASAQNFQVGDNLVFTFASGAHTVTEVTKSDYDSCSSSNAISNSNTAPTTVLLASAGTHYFICGVPGHCSSGQKLSVTAGGSGSSSGSGSTNSTSTTSPTYIDTYSSANLVPVGSNAAILTGLVMLKLGFSWA